MPPFFVKKYRGGDRLINSLLLGENRVLICL